MGKWTYSGNPAASQLDELRFLVQDTDSCLQLLFDEELSYLLNRWLPIYGSVTYVASIAADTLARKYAGLTNISADGVSVDVSGLSDKYAKIAVQLRVEYRNELVGGDIAQLDTLMHGETIDPSLTPLTFGVGLMDNLYAGRQDYGGTLNAAEGWYENWNESSP